MVKLAHNLLIITCKLILFVGLFSISMRFIHTYPLPMPPEHQRQLFAISEKIGIRDPRDFYRFVVVIVNLIAATIEFKLLIRLWEKCKESGSTRCRRG